MILYGCAVTDGDAFARCAEAGVRPLLSADGELLAQPSVGSVARNYNLLCDRAAERDDLEALVLLHQDVEIVDPRFPQTVRETLADPEVAIAGCAGAIGVRGLAWWEGSITWASVTQRYEEFGGGGEIPGISWRADREPARTLGTGEVDAIDGCLIVLSPWAVRNLSFDEQLARRHGYDVDICLQARAAGRKVVTADLRVVHHHSLDLLPDPEEWIQAHIALAEKWEGQLGIGDESGDWRRRALRAEAEAARRTACGWAPPSCSETTPAGSCSRPGAARAGPGPSRCAGSAPGSGGLASEVRRAPGGGTAAARRPAAAARRLAPRSSGGEGSGLVRIRSMSMSSAARSSTSAARSARETFGRPPCLTVEIRSASAKAREPSSGSRRPISR